MGVFDIIGFSLQYELSYTNMLNMMDMGGIPLRSDDRLENHPLIIAGGPCTFNPAPLESFIDAFVIGEGEEVVAEITAAVSAAKKQALTRKTIIEKLSEISGIYVPRVHGKKTIIKKGKLLILMPGLTPSHQLCRLCRPSMTASYWKSPGAARGDAGFVRQA